MKELLIVITSSTMLSCADPSKKPGSDREMAETQDIFPVSSFVAGQVHGVDSLQVPVLKYTTIDNKTDTVLISTAEFKTLAKEFMEPDISSDPSLKKYYKESSFADQSVPSVSLIYSTVDKDLEIQRMDVVIQPDPYSHDKVKSIYMEKISIAEDTSILKKLYWKANKSFLIITSKHAGTNPAITTQLKVVWDNVD